LLRKEKKTHAAREADLNRRLEALEGQLVTEREGWQLERDRLESELDALQSTLAEERERWKQKEASWAKDVEIRRQQDVLEKEFRERRDELQRRLLGKQGLPTGYLAGSTAGNLETLPPRPIIHHPTLLIRTIPPTLNPPDTDPTSWEGLLNELRGVQFDPNEFVAAHCKYQSKLLDMEVPCDSPASITYPYCLRHTLYHSGLFVWKSRIDGAGWGLFAGMTG